MGTNPSVTSAACACAAPKAPWLRRATTTASWIIPSGLLAIMPKCPMCLAGYIAVATGLGVSMTAATYLRSGLIALCVAALVLAAVRLVRRWSH